MKEHIKELLAEKLLDDERFREAFCDSCSAITHDDGDGLFNPPVDDCPADFFIGDRDCAKIKDWERVELALEIAAGVVAECTNKEVLA